MILLQSAKTVPNWYICFLFFVLLHLMLWLVYRVRCSCQEKLIDYSKNLHCSSMHFEQELILKTTRGTQKTKSRLAKIIPS